MGDFQRFLGGILPAISRPPPSSNRLMKSLALSVTECLRPPPDPSLDIRYRLGDCSDEHWEGRDVFVIYSEHRFGFFELTGETPETLLQITSSFIARYGEEVNERKKHSLSPRNRVMLFMIWLRSYPTYQVLSLIFDISVSSVSEEIVRLLPIFESFLSRFVVWPSRHEWQSFLGKWPKIPCAVGAIDGTSVEIYKPNTVPEELYYSGHRHYHAIHTQVIVDVDGNIRYVESGFVGHQNDAQQYQLMSPIGMGILPFPGNCCLLGDKIYPNRHPIMTGFTSAQIHRQPRNEQRKHRKFNRILSSYRSVVERTIGEMKKYKILSSLWRHPRENLQPVVHRQDLLYLIHIIAGIVCRSKETFQ